MRVRPKVRECQGGSISDLGWYVLQRSRERGHQAAGFPLLGLREGEIP